MANIIRAADAAFSNRNKAMKRCLDKSTYKFILKEEDVTTVCLQRLPVMKVLCFLTSTCAQQVRKYMG